MASKIKQFFRKKKPPGFIPIQKLVENAEKGWLHPDKEDMREIRRRFVEITVEEMKQLHAYKIEQKMKLSSTSLDQVQDWQKAYKNKADAHYTKFEVDRDLNQKVALWYGDISQLEVDVIISSTSSRPVESLGGVSYVICNRAGPLLTLEANTVVKDQLKVGHVAVTAGYLLPARYVYHMNGPKWNFADTLKTCYVNCLNEMKKMGLRTIAFPCISTGAKGLNLEMAASVAIETTREWLQKNRYVVDKIIFSVFDRQNWKVYSNKMPSVFPVTNIDTRVAKNIPEENATIGPEDLPEVIPESPEIDAQSSLPIEILRMDKKSIDLYRQALTEGEEAVYNIRVMVVGHNGVGKTVLTRRMLEKDVDITTRKSTNGIEIHVRRCKVSREDGQWTVLRKDETSDDTWKRLTNILTNQGLNQSQEVKTELTEQDKFDEVDGNVDLWSDGMEADGNQGNCDEPETPPTEEQHDDLVEDTTAKIVADPDEPVSHDLNEATGIQHVETEDDLKKKETMMREELKELICKASKLGFQEEKDLADLSIWDFAGQYAFYATHQVFLSPRAVYLLVTDISEHIDKVVMDDECHFDCSGSKCCTVSEFIEFWLNSIHGYCTLAETSVPPVILVGTHADKLDQSKKEELVESYFDALRNLLGNNDISHHLVDEEFAVDNTIEDPILARLKKKILEVASKQNYWGELIPARWISLEKALFKLRDDGVKIIERKFIEDIGKAMPVPLSSDEELKLFLTFQHDSGNILYFSDEGLQDKILLDPQWLIDGFKCLITADKFRKNAQIYNKWREFNKTAILKRDLIDMIWKKEEANKFHQHQAHLIGLLERFDIIAKPLVFLENKLRTQVEDYFFAPCVLKDKPPPDIATFGNSDKTTSKLCFTVASRFIPIAIFNRLLAACLTRWPISPQTENDKRHVYCGCGIFDVDPTHRLTLYFCQNVINIWVTKYGKKQQDPCVQVCTRVREFIEQNLKRINGQLRQSSEIEVFVKCPNIDLESSSGLHKLEDFFVSDEVACHYHSKTHVLDASEMLHFWYGKIEVERTPEVQQSRLPFNLREKVPNVKEIAKMSRVIGKEYEQLGIELGLSQAELDQIKLENGLVANQIKCILQKWTQHLGCTATLEELEKAMFEVKIDTRQVFENSGIL